MVVLYQEWANLLVKCSGDVLQNSSLLLVLHCIVVCGLVFAIPSLTFSFLPKGGVQVSETTLFTYLSTGSRAHNLSPSSLTHHEKHLSHLHFASNECMQWRLQTVTISHDGEG